MCSCPAAHDNLTIIKGVDHSKKSLSKFYLNTFYLEVVEVLMFLAGSYSEIWVKLFVLQCKHRQGDSSNPGNVIESP